MGAHVAVFSGAAWRSSWLALMLLAGAAHAQQAPHALDPALLPLAEQETAAVLETLRALTSFDSGSGQAPGMAGVADHIERFAKGLGGEVERVLPAGDVVGPNLVITFKGTGKRRIMLLSHMDTVYPAGTAGAKPFRVEGNRAIAPGIADDKSGIAVFLHAMKLLKASGFTGYERVTMVFNSDEERGSAGSRALIRSRAGAHDAILSGEPTGQQEVIVMGTSGVGLFTATQKFGGPFGAADARPVEEMADLVLRTRDAQQQVAETRMNWTLLRVEDPAGLSRLPAQDWQFATLMFRVKGRASHAGTAPNLGVNAVTETAALVHRTTEIAAGFPQARWHWRSASGGLVTNIIPDRGMAVLEVALPKGGDLAPVLAALTQRSTQALLLGAEVEASMTPGLTPAEAGPGRAFATANQRVPDDAAYAELGKAARALVAKQKFASSSITVQDGMGFPAYTASEEGRKLAEVAKDIYTRLGGTVAFLPRTFGGTDAVFAAQSGKPVVEGMGLPGGNYHSSEEEFVLVDRIPRRLAFAAEMIRAIAAR